MRTLRTVVLRHETRGGSHYDWLVEHPSAGPGAGLWTVRTTHCPALWHTLGRLPMTPLPPHRRHYLTYQGPVSGGRGTVRRIAAGKAFATLWTESRLVLDVHFPDFAGRIEANRVSADTWHAHVLPST